MAIINGVTTTQGMEVDVTPKAGRVILYDAQGNAISFKDQTAITPGTTSGLLTQNQDRGLVSRLTRGSRGGETTTHRPSLLLLDTMEGSTTNTVLWTKSESGYAMAQLNGVLTLGNTSSATSGSFDILTSNRQFQWYKDNKMTAIFRVNFGTIQPNAVYEIGFGAPSGATALINNSAILRITSAGTVELVINFNGGSDQVTVLTGVTFTSTTFYSVAISTLGRRVHIQIEDENGNFLADQWVTSSLVNDDLWSVTHLPVFARIYNSTAVGAGAQLKLGSCQVYMEDLDSGKSWPLQLVGTTRHGTIHPTTFAQTASSMTAAPATQTPSNTVGGYNFLGGDYANALTVASENPLSVFAFQIPSPYTFFLTSITLSLPVVTTAISVTGLPFVEWLAIANCASGNISTGGGQKFPLCINHYYTAITQAAGVTLNLGGATTAGGAGGGGPATFVPQTPIACFPGTFLHIAWKVFITSAVTTAGVTRGSVYIDGFFD